MEINANYKDSVFTSLFSNPASLRELYCALRGVTLPPDTPVSINTLEKVLYMDLYNDISFEIGGKLVVLVEHQSTINPNMALRFLLYISRVLEKKFKGRTLYSTKPVSVPYPEFFVLYNGAEKFPDEQILKLSDLFSNPKELGLTEPDYPLLELEVRVININEGRNEEIVKRCGMLHEYSVLIAKIRSLINDSVSLEEAVKKAIVFCQKNDILAGYLEIHGSEVFNMLLTEWNWDDCIAVRSEEAREDGRKEASLSIARNLLSEGSTPEFVHRTTGLSMDEISKLRQG